MLAGCAQSSLQKERRCGPPNWKEKQKKAIIESWLMTMLVGSPSVGGDRSAVGIESRFGSCQEAAWDGAPQWRRQR
jgi:hypothetical protein